MHAYIFIHTYSYMCVCKYIYIHIYLFSHIRDGTILDGKANDLSFSQSNDKCIFTLSIYACIYIYIYILDGIIFDDIAMCVLTST